MTIAQAARTLERLRFTYRTNAQHESERRVEPYRLVNTDRRWYLVARDLDRAAWRTARVGTVAPFLTSRDAVAKTRSMSLHPTDGVRLLLELEHAEGASARYRGSLFLPSERADYSVDIDAVGVTLRAIEGHAPAGIPEAAVDLLRAIARTVARHAAQSDPPTWPRRSAG